MAHKYLMKKSCSKKYSSRTRSHAQAKMKKKVSFFLRKKTVKMNNLQMNCENRRTIHTTIQRNTS